MKRYTLIPRFSKPIRFAVWSAGCLLVLVILIPVFGVVGERVRTPSCAANLKQVGLSIFMYSSDWDDRLPCASNWMDATYPYAKTWSVYRCPEVARSSASGFGYAYNRTLSSKKTTAIHQPQTTALTYDSDDLSRNASAVGILGLANPPRHVKGNNIAYADGHVKLGGEEPP